MEINHPTLVIIVSLLLSAFFSGVEIAFISANRLQLEIDNKSKKWGASFFSKQIVDPAKFITTMLIGNNIALVIYSIAMGQVIAQPLVEALGNNNAVILLIQTLISTLIILMTAEFLPKVLFKVEPNRTLNIFYIPAAFFYYLLSPLRWVFQRITQGTLVHIFKLQQDNEAKALGKEDLDNYVKQAAEQMEATDDLKNEIDILNNALDFTSLKARECMVPRNEIIALELHDDISILKKTLIDTGLSKILIFKSNIDNIIGYVHVNEMLKKPESIKKIIRPISIVPESMLGSEVLGQLIQQKRSIAIVVDEFGGTSGMITMEDVIEEIFGEIEDEHDTEQFIEQKIDDDTYEFSARLEINYLNKTYNLNLPESDEYETLAGLIFQYHESIPEVSEIIEIDPFEIEILKMSDNRIELVKIIIKSEH